MAYIALILLGLCLGSFVNALVWRIHEQGLGKKGQGRGKAAKIATPHPSPLTPQTLSILTGRSMCPRCHHTLKWDDLVPVLSWLWLKGKCRYCKKPISWQYPLVELVTAGLFVLSYAYWPDPLTGAGLLGFIVWLPVLTGLLALFIYDLKWMILPNKIIYPMIWFVALASVAQLVFYDRSLSYIVNVGLGLLAGGGIFYALFQISGGRWIGGGDVKLGALLGILLASPARSLLLLFIASLLGTGVTLPMLLAHKAKATTRIPFGPFLIIAAIIVRIFGESLVGWYRQHFLIG